MESKHTVRVWGGVEGPRQWLRRGHSRLICSMLIAPMGIGVEIPRDSLDAEASLPTESAAKTTTFSFGAGMGEYGRTVEVSRSIIGTFVDCSGGEYTGPMTVTTNLKFRTEFIDAGGEIDHQLSSSWHVGARGGVIRDTVYYLGAEDYSDLFDSLGTDTTFTYGYINPFVSWEKEKYGMGLGVVFAGNRLWPQDTTTRLEESTDDSVYPTWHLRYGRMDKLYINTAGWEGVPIYSGGGAFVLGIGGRPIRRLGLWAGLSAFGPYDNEGLLIRAGWDVNPRLAIGANVRWNTDSDNSFPSKFEEYGGSLLMTYRLIRP